jgi:hypothetical protein
MSTLSDDNTGTQTAAIAFAGVERIAAGDLRAVAMAVKERADRDPAAAILVFDVATGERIELDLRGTVGEVVGRLSAPPDAEPAPVQAVLGRPKLGVVAREVTLLPRHWDWLGRQPGGASVALRKLVDAARHVGADGERVRLAREAVYRFLTTMAGDEPGYEEAIRALFAGDRERFDVLVERWPVDIRAHARDLAASAFAEITG